MLEDGVKVKHKVIGYQGIVVGRTKIKNLFTGNVDCDFQYRIRTHPAQDVKIAPEEDLCVLEPKMSADDRVAKAQVVLDLECGTDPTTQMYKCVFEISSKTQQAEIAVVSRYARTFDFVRSRTAIRDLQNTAPGKRRLEIIGKGYDNRCRWCRSFRKMLKNEIRGRYGNHGIYQSNYCVFDQRQGLDVDDPSFQANGR